MDTEDRIEREEPVSDGTDSFFVLSKKKRQRVPKLSEDDEWQLIEKIRAGDDEAFRTLLHVHKNLIRRHIGLLVQAGVGNHLLPGDLEQEVCIGFLDAVKRFDPDKGARFGTYATRRVHGSILDAVRGNSFMGRALIDTVRMATKIRNRLAHELLRAPTAREWEEELPLSLRADFQMIRMLYLEGSLLSLDELVEADLERLFAEMVFQEWISTEREAMAQEKRRELASMLERGIAGLNERQRRIISCRFPQKPGDAVRTLQDLGEELGVTESRACQLQAQALLKLREYLSARYASRHEARSTSTLMPCL